MKRLLPVIFLLASFPVLSQASASAAMKARVKVVEPIKITKSLDMNFGNVISGTTAGQLVLSPNGTRVANGVELATAVPGEVNPAQALVTHGSYSYSINLPKSFILFNESDPNQIIKINQFVARPFPSQTTGDADILRIGATLHLQANQSSGNYTNPSGFLITVSYN